MVNIEVKKKSYICNLCAHESRKYSKNTNAIIINIGKQ